MKQYTDVSILLAGHGAWAFEPLARRLADALWVEISEKPLGFNYVLAYDRPEELADAKMFVPWAAMLAASDKRRLAERFVAGQVPTPATFLCNDVHAARDIVRSRPEKQWCVKFPTGTGAAGHRLFAGELPNDWPLPIVLQEFIPLARPEVFRTYCAGGEIFGWVVRRHPDVDAADPWVAHARGARYERAGPLPTEAERAATAALKAAGLLNAFGCVDLLQTSDRDWTVLEVGTDGIFNHVDRDLGIDDLEHEIEERIATAFWKRLGPPPWGTGSWHRRKSCHPPT